MWEISWNSDGRENALHALGVFKIRTWRSETTMFLIRPLRRVCREKSWPGMIRVMNIVDSIYIICRLTLMDLAFRVLFHRFQTIFTRIKTELQISVERVVALHEPTASPSQPRGNHVSSQLFLFLILFSFCPEKIRIVGKQNIWIWIVLEVSRDTQLPFSLE